MLAKLTSKNQLTLPKAATLGLGPQTTSMSKSATAP